MKFYMKKLRTPTTKTIFLKQKKNFYENLFNNNEEKC